MAITCRKCGAAPFSRCFAPNGFTRNESGKPHKVRVEDAAAGEMTEA